MRVPGNAIVVTALLLAAQVSALSPPASADSPLAAIDAAWRARLDAQDDPVRHREAARALVAACEDAVEALPDDPRAHWQLLRGIYYLGEFGNLDEEERRGFFDRGRAHTAAALGALAREAGIAELTTLPPEDAARRLEGRPEAAPVYFWSAVVWGLWGRDTGRLAAARAGVAQRLRDLATVVSLLDPEFEDGGGYRLLGRLHSEAPRIPLFTGWVDHSEAVRLLEMAVAIAPGIPANELYLAEALLDHRPQESSRGRELLVAVTALQPRAEHRLEDRAAIAEARSLLERHAQ